MWFDFLLIPPGCLGKEQCYERKHLFPKPASSCDVPNILNHGHWQLIRTEVGICSWSLEFRRENNAQNCFGVSIVDSYGRVKCYSVLDHILKHILLLAKCNKGILCAFVFRWTWLGYIEKTKMTWELFSTANCIQLCIVNVEIQKLRGKGNHLH